MSRYPRYGAQVLRWMGESGGERGEGGTDTHTKASSLASLEPAMIKLYTSLCKTDEIDYGYERVFTKRREGNNVAHSPPSPPPPTSRSCRWFTREQGQVLMHPPPPIHPLIGPRVRIAGTGGRLSSRATKVNVSYLRWRRLSACVLKVRDLWRSTATSDL